MIHLQPFSDRQRRSYRLIRNIVAVWLTLIIGAGFLLDIPRMAILEHTARNLYFHVPMWFTMMAGFLVSAYHSMQYLRTGDLVRDVRAAQAAKVGAVFGCLGLATGILWARFTWYVGADIWWNWDPKQTMAAVQLLIYGAYFVLRTAVEGESQRGRVAAAYNLFAFATIPFLLFVLPRQMESLHPGAEGNPAFSEFTAPVMRYVLYPAFIGFIGLFWVLYTQRVRLELLKLRRRYHRLSATISTKMLSFVPLAALLTLQDIPSSYDTTWNAAQSQGPPQSSGFEQVMLSQDKLYVVAGVVLIIWFGLLFYLFRNDRRIRALEREADVSSVPDDAGDDVRTH